MRCSGWDELICVQLVLFILHDVLQFHALETDKWLMVRDGAEHVVVVGIRVEEFGC